MTTGLSPKNVVHDGPGFGPFQNARKLRFLREGLGRMFRRPLEQKPFEPFVWGHLTCLLYETSDSQVCDLPKVQTAGDYDKCLVFWSECLSQSRVCAGYTKKLVLPHSVAVVQPVLLLPSLIVI